MTPGGWLSRTDLLIGIDDTDDIDTIGTGRHVQDLMRELADAGLGTALGATRHQLLYDARIPMTSHNCSACISWALPEGADPVATVREIEERSAAYLRRNSAAAADPGLAVVRPATLTADARRALAGFGASAKQTVLDQPAAHTLAAATGVALTGHGGTDDGVIGALAAVGLVLSGTDGLFLWMPGVRELTGRISARELLAMTPIDELADPRGVRPDLDDLIELGDWVRPLLWQGRSRLLLLRSTHPDAAPWRAAPRYLVKEH